VSGQVCVDFAALYDLSIRFWNCFTSMVSFVFHFMTRLNYDFREYKFIAFVMLIRNDMGVNKHKTIYNCVWPAMPSRHEEAMC
jgi:hypothetical protein